MSKFLILLEGDYRKRRAAVMKKLRVLGRNKIYGEGSKADIAYIKQALPPESQIENARNARRALESLKIAEESNLYSVRGRRRIEQAKIRTLAIHGIRIKDRKDLRRFGEFMEDVRAASQGRIYDSTKAAEIFHNNSSSDSANLLDLYRESIKRR